MDARAEELLRAIATSPADDAPRLAFAEHIKSESPAHAALIIAQCTGTSTRAIVDAFRDELPTCLQLEEEPDPDDPEPPPPMGMVRGFSERLAWRFEQRDFLELDPDVLFRLAPACRELSLQDATDFDAIGARIRRFDTVRFASTHIDNAAARRLA